MKAGIASLICMSTLCAVSSVFFSATSAEAAELICKSTRLTKSDERAVIAVLRRSIGDLAIDSYKSRFCKSFGSARAWFETARVPGDDGAFSHVSGSCSRGFMRWQCDVSKVRSVDFVVDGTSDASVFIIPENMTSSAAHQLIDEAFAITRAGLKNETSCSRSNADADRLRGIGEEFLAPRFWLRSEVAREKFHGVPQTLVYRGAVSLNFSHVLSDAGAEGFKFVCWEEWLIVD